MKQILKLKEFIITHPNFFTFIGLGIIFYLIFFHNIGNYALMDVDESRYVLMAKDMFNTKDFFTLYLNNEYFFEKPPLYFWGECLSFAIFGKINEFTARFPVALYGTLCCYVIYFIGKKVVSRLYGVIASLILATSLEFLILAKFAILDIVVSTCIGFSLCFGLIVYFCRENHKKYYWWLFYAFSALAVMAKGIPGFVVPFGSMFFVAIIAKKFKELFKPIYFIPGTLIFLLIVLPWHIAMFKTYNPLFWDEYIVKHHLARFAGGEIIHRDEPFYFYIVTLLWGFFPWVISCLAVGIKNLIQIIKNKTFTFKYEELNKPQQFMLYNTIVILFTLLFFSSSGTKLITYILPMYGALACIGAYVWKDYIENKNNVSLINKTNYFLGGLFLFTSLAGILTPLYLPQQLYQDISTVKTFCVVSTFAVGLAIILFTRKKIYAGVFASLVIFMSIFSAHATEKFFEIDYKFGQDDLIKYAKIADEHNKSLTTFDFGQKYSLIFYGNEPVSFYPDPILENMPADFQNKLKVEDNYLIIRKKDLKNIGNIKYKVLADGRKYLLVDEVK